MLKKFAPALLAVAVLGFASGASAGTNTTEPTEVNDVLVILKDNGLKLSRAKFERGDQARFLVRNAGTQPYRFKAGSFKTKLLKRGQHAIMIAHLGLRGRFPVEQWSATARVSRAFINVV
jgi:hypothetical protein